jgi:hypothetical protein
LLREDTRTLSGAQHTYTIGFAYDADGNRSAVRYPSTQLTVQYEHDYAGRPISASGFVTSASYLPFGPLTEIYFHNWLRQSATYDARYRMTGNQFATNPQPPGRGAILAEYSYLYDPAGSMISMADMRDASYNRSFAYDDLNRLIAANTGSSLWQRGTYTWDAMGNITSLALGGIEKGPTEPLDLARDMRNRMQTQENIPRGRSSMFRYSGSTPRLVEIETNSVARSVRRRRQ